MSDTHHAIAETPKTAPAEALSKIEALQSAMQDMPQIDLPLEHFFPKGLYARKIFMPAGSTVVSKVHKYEHLTVALTGRASVVSEDGAEKEIVAPAIFITHPGTKRALHIHEDAIWLTVHATELRTVEECEAELVADTVENYLQQTRKFEVLP